MTPVRFRILVVATMMPALLLLSRPAAAHCDTMDGPVVKAAQLAIKRGDVTPILKWVPKTEEAQIRALFGRTLKVRSLSPEARELADNYFFETVVRVHRAGEGESFTGLKPSGTPIEPGIALADNAVATDSVDSLIRQVTSDVAEGIHLRFTRVQQASKHANDSVEAGRQYAAAYVEFIHYIEDIHKALSATSRPGHREAQEAEARLQSKE